MSRYTQIIHINQLKEKLKPLLEQSDFPYDLPSQVEKDLSKINFDFENYDFEEGYSEYPCGFRTLPNGVPVLFVNAGGDWEHPICFILYWDGKKIRGYIPEDGNVFNRKQKCAYGSEENGEDIDFETLPKPDSNAIINDIMKRIIVIGHE